MNEWAALCDSGVKDDAATTGRRTDEQCRSEFRRCGTKGDNSADQPVPKAACHLQKSGET